MLVKTAMKIYAESKKIAAEYESLQHFINTRPDFYECWQAWSILAFCFRGLEMPFEVGTYERYGKLQYTSYGDVVRSYNAMTDSCENGVSTTSLANGGKWENTMAGVLSISACGKKISFKGIPVDVGGDGEIVVIPVE